MYKFPLAVAVVLWGAHLNSISLSIGGIEFTAHDFAVTLGIGILLLPPVNLRIPRGRYLALLACVVIFAIWSCITIFWSEASYAAIFILPQLRFTALFAALMLLAPVGPREVHALNRTIWRSTVVIAAGGLLLYLWAWRTGSTTWMLPVFGETRFGILRHVGAPRAIGLAHDPNFFALWLVPGLMVGLMSSVTRGSWRIAGSALILAAIVLGMSRVVFIAVPLAVFLVLILSTLASRGRRMERMRSSAWAAGGLVLAFAAVVLVVRNVEWAADAARDRYELGTGSRIGRLHALQESVRAEDLVVGLGSRSAHATLMGRYSHNTYVDVLVEFGVVGLSVWLAVMAIGGIGLFRGIRLSAEWLPWLGTGIAISVALLGFSLLTHPMLAVVMAVAGGGLMRRPALHPAPRPVPDPPLPRPAEAAMEFRSRG